MLEGRELADRYPTELLGRSQLGRAPTEAARELFGRRIVVTGAGGSVGRPLARLLADAKPERLVLLDHHEASLFALYRHFGDRFPPVELVLGDVRNAERMADVFRAARPQVVVHLAAYKHVPFGELFPGEACSVNTLATRSLLELSASYGVEQFVYASSDKACRPPSLYGATKRLGEACVRAAAGTG